MIQKRYSQTCISIKNIKARPFNIVLGICNDNKKTLKYFKMFLKYYCSLTDRDYDEKATIKYPKYYADISIYSWNDILHGNSIPVSSWKDIYMLYVALMYTYKAMIHSYDYAPAMRNFNNEVSVSPNHKEFKMYVSKFIVDMLTW